MIKELIAASLVWIFLTFAFAVVITFLSPSVAESVMPELGECDITYNGIFYPCMTWGEAFRVNLIFSSICALVITIVFVYNTHGGASSSMV